MAKTGTTQSNGGNENYQWSSAILIQQQQTTFKPKPCLEASQKWKWTVSVEFWDSFFVKFFLIVFVPVLKFPCISILFLFFFFLISEIVFRIGSGVESDLRGVSLEEVIERESGVPLRGKGLVISSLFCLSSWEHVRD